MLETDKGVTVISSYGTMLWEMLLVDYEEDTLTLLCFYEILLGFGGSHAKI